MKRLGLVGGILVVALVASVAVRASIDAKDPVVIVHWANSHPMRDGLLPDMAEQFNREDHETADGRPIKVVVIKCDSSNQAADLVARINGAASEDGCRDDANAPVADPTIVTPQSDDWIIDVNAGAQKEVVDLDATVNIAETWLGIVTYRAMAECLRASYPGGALGYAELSDLLERGWEDYPACDEPRTLEWGVTPPIAFTNPSTSTSGRNALVTLYSMAAGKAPADLTEADIESGKAFVAGFQKHIRHYMPGTIDVNTKISQGLSEGQFFLLPEDNLANLYMGREKFRDPNGNEQTLPKVTDLVMIYPKEGSVLNSNPAAVVKAGWVTDEQREGSSKWIKFLREDRQQEHFMAAGFRPPADLGLQVAPPQFEKWGLDPEPPSAIIEPGRLEPPVLKAIIDSWGQVKPPVLVTFVVDQSKSMDDSPGSTDESLLDQVKRGLYGVLAAMSGEDSAGQDNWVSVVTFSNEVDTPVAPGPYRTVEGDLGVAIEAMEPTGAGTALYTAVQEAVRLTDDADVEPGTTRAVVVLSDGRANHGICLDRLVRMSTDEEDVSSYCARVDRPDDPKVGTRSVRPEDVRGDELLQPLDNDIQVFFVGFGSADANIGRILADATGAESQGSTDEDLATVIQELSGYF